MPWPIVAVTVVLFGLTGLFTLAVASSWRKLSDSSGLDVSPNRLRSASGGLSIVLFLLGLDCLWVAYLALDWIPR